MGADILIGFLWCLLPDTKVYSPACVVYEHKSGANVPQISWQDPGDTSFATNDTLVFVTLEGADQRSSIWLVAAWAGALRR